MEATLEATKSPDAENFQEEVPSQPVPKHAAAAKREEEWKNPSLGRKIALGFSISLLIVIVIGLTSYWSIRRLLADGELDSHSRQVLETISDLGGQLKDGETAQRGYVITARPDYLVPYQEAIAKIRTSLDSLRELTADNPSQQQRIDHLQKIIHDKFVEMQHIIDLRNDHGFPAAQTGVLTNMGKNLMDQARKILAEMTQQEKQLLAQRVAAHTVSARWAMWVEIIGSLVAITVVVAAGAVIHRDIRARVIAEKMAAELNHRLDLHAVELEATNKELEAFSYSVSHDLRAPLRSISGFSDALREDCKAEMGESAQDYLKRICGATDRMSRLIDDLLNLARVTRAELRKEPVNLSALAQQVVHNLRRNDPQRRMEFTAEPNHLPKPLKRAQLLSTVARYLPGGSARAPATPPKIHSTLQDEDIRPYLGEFCARLPSIVAELQVKMEQRGLSALQKIVHGLKGTGGLYGFPQITQAATYVEESLEAAPSDDLQIRVENLLTVIRSIDAYPASRAA